jgi:hypothetical protein
MRRALGIFAFLCLIFGNAFAADDVSIPPQLRDWQRWVLHGQEQRTCPLLNTQDGSDDNAYQCAWPGRLSLIVDKAGAHFQLDVHVDAESWIDLPGSREAWPQQVQIGNAPATVLDRNGTPSLRLTAGDYIIRGVFEWDERPARLQVPDEIALIDLNVDGASIAEPERNGDSLTLGQAAAQRREADALSLRVFRRLADGAPPMLDTQLRLHVAGSAREQLLGPALPNGFVATALQGDLPARMEPDGRLRVQLRPGNWNLDLSARGLAPLTKIEMHSPPAPWPQQEIWSYADAPAFRTTRASGAQPIDPAQADVPDDWRTLPAFVISNGAALAVEQRARGRDANSGDHLQLSRELWLDFDGRGLTADDRLRGTLRSSDRLDVAVPWILERAALHDENPPDAQPLLVTRGANANLSGVEIRAGTLDLHAGLRRDAHGGSQPAAGGWQQSLDGVDARLHLPYGYRLLGAPGADKSPDSWVAQWNLLDLFVAAVIALLAWRLLGWQWGLVALGFVVLSQSEPGAPRWLPGIAVALALVARALPQGKLRNVARYAGMAMLALAVLATLPFGAEQLRDAMHPQLERSSFVARLADQFASTPSSQASKPGFQEENAPQVKEMVEPPPAAPPPQPPPVQEVSQVAEPAPPPPPSPAAAAPAIAGKQALRTIVVTGSHISALNIVSAEGYPPNMIVQSGRGVPAWSDIGSTYRLSWSGPVTPDEDWRLVILPAWATRILRIVMLGLLIAWLAAIARAFDLPTRLPRWPRRVATGGAVILLLTVIAPHAHAQSMPSQELLSQLRDRLLEAPKCAPQCAASPVAQIAMRAEGADVTIEVDAGARIAFPLPYMDAPAALANVTLDGKPAAALTRRDGQTWIALERGVHRVGLSFAVGNDADNAVLHFPLAPPRAQVSAQGWQVSGVDGTKLLSDTLTFARERVLPNSDKEQTAQQAFPPYVTLTRSIALGLDSRVDNTVQRVAPAQGGFTVGIPLLPGEHVTNSNLKVEHGRVQIVFDSGQGQAGWSSTLDPTGALALHAPAFGERAETWQIGAAPLLHPVFSGVPESSEDAPDGEHVFHPLPGETLRVEVARPAALSGDSIAFDQVMLDATRGDRALESMLTLNARSTRGGEHGIDLPRDAQLLAVQRGGEPLELNLHDGHLALPVQPGVQTFTLRFREPSAIGMSSGTPQVALHARAANIKLSLSLPQDRWVLWTWGPQAGPAVLYWPELIALLIVAIALACFAPTPLRWWQWLLLGLGFSTFAWSAYVLVALWLIALGLRARGERAFTWERTTFNLMQIGLAVLTAIALLCLISAVPQGLLGQPDMRVTGNDSTAWSLQWFADQSRDALPHAGAFSLPLWTYKLAMLAWALWLANALIGWLRWGFDAWTRGGYWKPPVPKTVPAPAPPSAQSPQNP